MLVVLGSCLKPRKVLQACGKVTQMAPVTARIPGVTLYNMCKLTCDGTCYASYGAYHGHRVGEVKKVNPHQVQGRGVR